MKKNYLLLLLCVLFCACTSQSDVTVEKPEIRFKDGKLRIAQFTDVHWDTGESAKGSDEHLPKPLRISLSRRILISSCSQVMWLQDIRLLRDGVCSSTLCMRSVFRMLL